MCQTCSRVSTRRRRGLILRIGVTVIGLVIVALALLLLRLQTQTPPILPGAPSGEIAFMSDRDGTWDVFAMDSGGQIRSLTAAGDGPTAGDWFPSWSLDSQQINFISDRSGERAPTQAKSDGSDPRTLTPVSAIITLFGEGRVDWDPAWSPPEDEPRRIVWSSLRDLNLELYVMDADGENRVRLTSHPARDWYPMWSPDGRRIAFSSDRAGNEDIYVIDTAGGEPSRLTDDPADDLRPMWSRDGSQIAFVAEREHPLTGGVVDVWVMEADGGSQRRLTPEIPFEGGLVWSPDGQQALFVSNQEGSWNIYAMNPDGSSVRRLTESAADDLYPVWRP